MSISGAGGYSPNINITKHQKTESESKIDKNKSKELKGVKPSEHLEKTSSEKPHLQQKNINKATEDLASLKKTKASTENDFAEMFPKVPTHKPVLKEHTPPAQNKNINKATEDLASINKTKASTEDDFDEMFPKVPTDKPVLKDHKPPAKGKVAIALTEGGQEKHIVKKNKNPK